MAYRKFATTLLLLPVTDELSRYTFLIHKVFLTLFFYMDSAGLRLMQNDAILIMLISGTSITASAILLVMSLSVAAFFPK